MSLFGHTNFWANTNTTLLKYVYEASITPPDPSFTPGTLSIGGQPGTSLSYVSGKLRFVTTSSTIKPDIVGTPAVSGPGWTASALALPTRNAQGFAINPSDFGGAAGGNQGVVSVGDLVVLLDAAYRNIYRTVTAVFMSSLSIDATFNASAVVFDIPGVIARGKTPNRGFFQAAAERGAADVFGYALLQIDTLLGQSPPIWTNISAFATNWSAATAQSSHYAPSYWKDPWGRVHLRGSLYYNGIPTLPSTMFTLPAGHWPASRWESSTMGRTATGPDVYSAGYVIRIDTNGDVRLVFGSGVQQTAQWVSLDDLVFPTA